MGQYVDIVGALSGEINEAGAKDLREHLIKVKQIYLPKFQRIRQELSQQYVSTDTFKNFLSIDERIEKAQLERRRIYASSKGGAYIMPWEEAEKTAQELEEIQKQRLNNSLKWARAQAYTIAKENKYRILAGQLMALVYSLKSQLTGTEEKFAFVYKGDSGYAETVTVPVTKLLVDSDIMSLMTIDPGSIERWSGIDDNALRFNSSVLAQIRNKYYDASNDLLNGLERGGNLLERYYNIKEYGTYSQIVGNKQGYKRESSALKRKSQYKDQEDYKIIREEDGKYYVVYTAAKYERGFITQGLLGQMIGDQNATFIGDSKIFYKNADIRDDRSGEEYSVKSFLDGQIPSLIKISTLYNVSSDIIRALSQVDNKAMGEQLTNIFNVTKIPLEKIDSLVNQDTENVVSKIFSG